MAPYLKRILCLANSRKLNGRCVAGKELSDAGQWIRPVSSQLKGELALNERRYANGADPELLDIIDIWLAQPAPHGFQVENHLIHSTQRWTFVRKATSDELAAAVDGLEGPLWDNSSSSYYGECDRVAEEVAIKHASSLKLVSVNSIKIRSRTEGAAFNNAHHMVRGRFSLNGSEYLLSVTDPVIAAQFPGEQEERDMGPATLCVSLGEPYRENAYKLIAGVIIGL